MGNGETPSGAKTSAKILDESASLGGSKIFFYFVLAGYYGHEYALTVRVPTGKGCHFLIQGQGRHYIPRVYGAAYYNTLRDGGVTRSGSVFACQNTSSSISHWVGLACPRQLSNYDGAKISPTEYTSPLLKEKIHLCGMSCPVVARGYLEIVLLKEASNMGTTALLQISTQNYDRVFWKSRATAIDFSFTAKHEEEHEFVMTGLCHAVDAC
ncbi:hypothetical protein F5888DRAFT_1634018 [Russula emetica]|nr:hypothetical protein F5888DRAFT_1634018 [Russula emetica]